jgi:hypothetical protein
MSEPLIAPLPDGFTELERITVYKALAEDGTLCIWHSATPGLRTWEALGMLIYSADTLRNALQHEGHDTP